MFTVSKSDQSELSDSQTVSSPGSTKITRKRRLTPSQWIDKKAKLSRDSGTEGIGRNGRPIPARKMGLGCTTKCRFKCRDRISFNDRQDNFNKFWALEGHARKWDHLARGMPFKYDDTSVKPKKYTDFVLETSDKRTVKVCHKMFIQTYGKIFLAIYMVLYRILKNRFEVGLI